MVSPNLDTISIGKKKYFILTSVCLLGLVSQQPRMEEEEVRYFINQMQQMTGMKRIQMMISTSEPIQMMISTAELIQIMSEPSELCLIVFMMDVEIRND